MEQAPLIGMANEVERLKTALRTGDPLLLLGPPGSGKTRVIQEALSGDPHTIYLPWEPSLHALLISMACALRLPEASLRPRTSVHLKGALWSALESSPVAMAMDGIAGAGAPAYRFLQRVYHTRGVALFAASRDMASLGALARLFWNPQKILHIPALRDPDARRLFEAAAGRSGLGHLDLDDFRERVLASAQGNPGQIIEMCRLAAQPKYHAGRHIKFSLVRIDTVAKFAR
jgi:DNA polymerase III delta prime subunit